MPEAWARLLGNPKLADNDRRKLTEIKAAMDEGLIGRDPRDSVNKRGAPKAFSKAEALRLYPSVAEMTREAKLADLVAKTPDNYVLANTPETLKQMELDVINADIVAIDCETYGENKDALDPWKGEMAGFSVSTRERHYYVPLAHENEVNVKLDDLSTELIRAMETTPNVMHNAPFDCKWFWVKLGVNLIDNLYADTRIMAMTMDENRSHRLKDLISDWLKKPSDNFDELFANTPFNKIRLEVALPYAAGDTEKTLELFDWIMEHLGTDRLKELRDLIFNIEMPVARTFIWSDIRGIKFDVESANKLDEKFSLEESDLQARIHEIFKEEVNLNSPAQLKKKLYEDLKLPDIDNGSTGVKTLKRIEKEHEVVSLILEYRGVGKLRQAFTSKLPHSVKSDGMIHPWHNTFGAATGRFTCKDPNTQQIPAKRPEVRKLFTTTGPDRILVSIDYSQIELRVLAHLANEKALIHAFHEGRDIHSTTAAMISNGKYTYEDIEKYKDVEGHECQKLRKQAKVVNFGIVYGMSAKGLSNTLEITEKEAKTIIENYFKGYSGIESYMDTQKKTARRQGFVTDIFGRKRRLANEYKAKDRFKGYGADRQAGNFPIQATAGSILKKAIGDLEPVLPPMNTYISLQCHDELVFDCPSDISRENLMTIKKVMEDAVKLIVPVNCDVEINPERWLEKVDINEWFEKREGA
ncbi:DNA polymerase [Alkalihalobacillus sp. LMS6]|uniref:DNA polymerase n=1 Tax=Alkalihalobacillus sp. LMS6 TaxID=2924034 RepID=UPI0020CFEC64|nr:DNA polymerase [Alkalihalobacillus sp. LMS6]UTR05186.1 DNA polymerase [Alkalihalobacillus sp. LMS6]